MFKKILAPLAGATLLVASAFSAQATTTTFNFTGSNANLGSSTTVSSGSFSIDVYAISNLFEPVFDFYEKSDIIRRSSGFGVRNSRFLDSSQIDNRRGLDYLVLDLGADNTWNPVSSTLGAFGGNDDYQIFGFDGVMDLTTSPADFAANLGAFTLLLDDDDNPAVFNTPNTFRYIIYSGTAGFFQNNDDYRVASFTGTVVPLPAALPLLATALAGFGVISWRRRRQTEA